ncbi:FtsK/SpoIIIE domain-containing protein [Streptomyces sp. NPDC059491]|uniref:FtsK/SpoIIIE domain-containing protein n=1 Tax=Streptomyces sp. NPDC059491 TaxID=3346850 RepID=UPI0036A412DA
MSTKKAAQEDAYGQVAGGIGGLAVAFGVLAAIKDKLGLSWPATIAVVAGLLVLLGYGAWRARALIARLRAGTGTAATAPATAAGTESPGATELGVALPDAASGTVVPHPELTAALITAGAIGKDEIIRADQVTITRVDTGTLLEFMVPPGKTYEDVEKRLGTLAGVFGVTRLHLTMMRSRDTERRVRILKLDAPPFSRPFPPPTRSEIEAFKGVALGHDVTGQLVGIPTFDKASMLVAGMTQSGKTTLINGLIAVLLIAYEEFDLYLLDGKFCGLTRFEKRAARYESSDDPEVFESIVDELNDRSERRYQKIKDAVRNREAPPKFKPVIFIVDEAADFFASDESKEGRERARRIAEKTRSLVAKALESGISTVLMTQRPSTNAIPVMVRDQFLYRISLYVASMGTAKVALGDTYFETIAPINPALLDPEIRGQGVLFANGRSTLLRGFFFPDEFMWSVVDEGAVHEEATEMETENAPLSPLEKAVELLRAAGVDFMATAELAPALGILEKDAAKRGKALGLLLGKSVQAARRGDLRGYVLADLETAARAAE